MSSLHPLIRLAATLAAGSFLCPSAIAWAQESPAALPLEVGTDLMTRLEIRDDYAPLGLVGRRLGESDGIVYRARLSLGLPELAVSDALRVSVLFQPQATGYWGDVSGNLSDPGVGMHQAKGRLAFDGGWLDVGRFEMAYGEHLVIGNVDWHQTGRAFDGLRFHGDLGSNGAYIDGFATILQEGSALDIVDPIFGGDFYFIGGYAGIGPMLAPGLELDTYLLLNIAPKIEGVPMPQTHTATEVTIGARVKETVGIATLRGEGGVQLGERPASTNDVYAYQVDADVMLAFTPMLDGGVGGFFASGDDPDTEKIESWNQLYPTAHKFLGLMDIIGARTNVAGGNVKLRVKPLAELALGIDGHLFWRPQTADGVDAYAGFESDMWGEWAMGKGLSLRPMFSFFVPNQDGPYAENDIAHYVEVQLRYKR